jgi:uncharacterized membrane protein
MEGIVILLVLFLLWLLIAPIVAMVKAGSAEKAAQEARNQVGNLMRRVRELENELRNVQRGSGSAAPVPVVPEPEEKTEMELAIERIVEEETRVGAIAEPVSEPVAPPPLPASQVRRKLIDYGEESAPVVPSPAPAAPAVAVGPKEPFSLERFMGVKLFAWLGGVAMFFGVIFFVKYAFENNLIPPAVRIALGFVIGTGLLIGGLATHRLPKYRVLAQAFCATGVLILYGVSFAAHAVYHFAAFGPVSTFVLMGLITLAAFLIAVRLNALVVAVLGMLGGFLTPVLLSTGHDNVFGLFGYIALLDIGLLAVSRHSNWRFLNAAAAAGTALMQIGWFEKFYTVGRYFEGPKSLIPMGIVVFFIAIFLAADWFGNRKRESDGYAPGSVIGLAAVAMLFAFVMLSFQPVAERYFLLYGFVLLVNLAVIALVMLRPLFGGVQMAVALLTFLHLAFWSNGQLKPETLGGALALYLVFGALHSVMPVALAKRMPDHLAEIPRKAGPWFAPLVVLMMLLPILQLPSVPLFIWVAVLLVNLLAIALATASGAVLPVLASLGLTMGVAAMWLLRAPAGDSHFLLPFLGVVSGFSAVFTLAGRWLAKTLPDDGDKKSPERLAAALLPVCSGLLPFGLLVLALLHLPVVNPSPVFGVALLLSVLLGGLALLGKQGPLVPAALAGTLMVQGVWHAGHFQPAAPLPALLWYLGFYGLFLVFPFVFRRQCAGQALPWIASALSGAGHFLLVHDLVKRSFPNDMMGLVPAAFAVPSLVALVMVIRAFPAMDEVNRSRVAWFGGVALLFITLIFPIQFDRQWLTVSWAMEGALLLWLFHRVPHPGLQLTGLALLAIAFGRLALNPAVFTDYPRSGTAIFNWHLYAYGLVAAAQFCGGLWFTDPAGRWAQWKPRGVLFAFGGILLFLLLNIEIADYFTAPGDRCIAFRFGGNFARDMTYSIAWGLFSLGLLGMGIWKKSKHARFAAIGLLVITLLKVFLHDLAAIENIFRIGALVGVAVIAFIASFLYQRFFDKPDAS